MTLTELVAELRSRGGTIEKPVAAFEHRVIRIGGRYAVIPAIDNGSQLGIGFMVKVARQLGIQF